MCIFLGSLSPIDIMKNILTDDISFEGLCSCLEEFYINKSNKRRKYTLILLRLF